MTDDNDPHGLVDPVLLDELRLLVDVMVAATQMETHADLAEVDVALGLKVEPPNQDEARAQA